MKAVYFNECFGWIHQASVPASRGVVICSAHGVEELCTHRFMRHLADKVAKAGMPALRFDYHGTGDSAGADDDPERVKSWLTSIGHAVEQLKRISGVSDVALIGFRMGSLLAAQYALENGSVSRLALLGPVGSGKSYIREMKALGLLISQTTRTQAVQGTGADNEEVVVAGFTISGATKTELQKIDLLSCTRAPAPEIFIAGRPATPSDERLVAHLRTLGCNVQHEVLLGYAELEWDTSFATLPEGAFDSVVSWIGKDKKSVTSVGSQNDDVHELRAADWIETPVQFGPGSRLFGILCEPTVAVSRHQKKLVLFVNHGSNPHTGWARMHVEFARHFAAHGMSSLRIDISGVGDSPAYPGFAENQLYARHSQKDVYAAMDWCYRHTSYREISLIGHCAGAYLGFFSAVRDERVAALVMLNLQRFFWPRGQLLESVSNETFRSSGWYWRAIGDLKVWNRVFTGKVNVTGIVAALTKRIWTRCLAVTSSALGGLLGADVLSNKVVRWLRDLSNRGTRVLLVYSDEDGGLDEIATHAGKNGKKVAKLHNVVIKIVEGADHNMTAARSQKKYLELLDRFLIE